MTQGKEQRRLIRLAQSINRRAQAAGSPDTVSPDELGWIVATFPNCFYCGVGLEPGQGSFDHRVSLGEGGINRPVNIVRSCMNCNRTKFTKTPEELREYQALEVSCSVCGKRFKPRWAEWKAGRGRTCSRSCAARSRFQQAPVG